TVDMTEMSAWSYTGSGLWLLPRAEGIDFPGNRGWYLRIVNVTGTDSLSIYRYDGVAPDVNGNLYGTQLTPYDSQRLDRDKPADILITVDGDIAVLTVDQSAYGGPTFTTPAIDLGDGTAFPNNGAPDVFLMGAHQVQSGNRGIHAKIDNLVVSAYAGDELANIAIADDLLRCYGILLEQPAPAGLQKSGGKNIYRAARDAYLHGDTSNFNTHISELEVWFASVADWYEEKDDYTHRMLHGQNFASAELYLQAAADLLSSGQTAGVQTELDAARAIKDTLVAPPVSYKSTANCWGWIKSYDPMGYRNHPDVTENMEPTPWLMFMTNSSNAGQSSLYSFVPPGPDHSYRNSRTIQQFPYTQAHFNNVPNNHSYEFERDWTTTQWTDPNSGKAITYSVLTPLMFQENTDTFYVRFLDAELSWVTNNEEVVALWLPSGGQFTAVTAGSSLVPVMDSPTAILETTTGYYLLVLPEQVESVSITNQELEIVTDVPTTFAMMKLTTPSSPTGDPSTYPDMITAANFWTNVALDCPIAVAESIQGTQVTMDYSYLTTSSSVFTTSPHRIAPVPPLATLALLPVSGVQQAPFHIMTHKDYGDYEYVDGSQLTYTIPAFNRAPLHGANIPIDSDFDAADYAELENYGVKLARLYQAGTTDPEVLKVQFDTALQLCRDHNMKAIIDPHNAIYRMGYNTLFLEDSLNDFTAWWVELVQVAAPYQDVVLGYDLYNEPPLDWETRLLQWVAQAQQLSTAIQAVDSENLIFVSGTCYGTPGGLYYADTELPDPLMRETFHMYTPYSFTHQKVPQSNPDAANTWYPDWVPGVDHGSTHYGYAREPSFYDRWNVGGSMLPVFEYAAKFNSEILLGEFSPLGYTRDGSENAAAVWNRHITDWAVRYGFDTTLWAYHGSGLEHPEVKAQMLDFWGYTGGMQLDAASITPYGDNQNGGNGLPADFTLSDGGRTITLTGNSWFKFELPETYNITPNTMLQVTFSSPSEAEIHGIGLEEDNDYNEQYEKRAIILYGTQYWDRALYVPVMDEYSNFAPDEVTYSVNLGSMYSNKGTMHYLIFVNDGDVAGEGVSVFKNIRLYEE
ncbi:MAG: cellulase family glycosylhydrolase, partial [Kiritimatiellae bacterium]|nr:cellulase family glycosylhydrolase [Kiritimatiellia bacterium]